MRVRKYELLIEEKNIESLSDFEKPIWANGTLIAPQLIPDAMKALGMVKTAQSLNVTVSVHMVPISVFHFPRAILASTMRSLSWRSRLA